jgi:GT2 family glycosyltransferase
VVSAIIVSFNTYEETRTCVGHLCATEPRPQIILVDNASSDETPTRIAREFPGITIIASDTNRGFSRANNAGAHQSAGEYLLFVNSDCFVTNDTVNVLSRYLRENPSVGIVGCQLLNPDGSLQYSVWKEPSLKNDFLSLFGWRELTSLWAKDPDQDYEAETLPGALLMVRRSCFEQINGFDERYFLYMEEMDLCFKARRYGWAIVFVHSARAVHLGGSSQRKLPIAKPQLLAVSLIHFYRTHYGRLAVAILVMMYVVSLPFRTCAHIAIACFKGPSSLCKLGRDFAMTLSLVANLSRAG